MTYTGRIKADHGTMLGKPVIAGTRITVEMILRKLSEGATIDDLLAAYPHLAKDDILATLSYSADVMAREEIIAV